MKDIDTFFCRVGGKVTLSFDNDAVHLLKFTGLAANFTRLGATRTGRGKTSKRGRSEHDGQTFSVPYLL